jgi:predicted permease
LQSVPPGFAVDHVLTMQLAANETNYRDDKSLAGFFREIEAHVAHLPGVVAQGMVSVLPLTGSVGWGAIGVEGYNPPPGQELQVDIRLASEDYFRAMQIPLIEGRFFSEHDNLDAPRVVIIDQKFAQRFWPNNSPIGRHMWFRREKPCTIVGVVGVVKQYGLDVDGKIVTYLPQQQFVGSGFLVVRTASDVAGLPSAVTREIHAVDPTVPVYEVRTMRDRLYESLARQRFSSTMLGALALFALALAAIGLYGVLSYLVTQSTRDIGVRVALGARPGDIIGMVVRHGMELVAIGIVAGVIGALMLTRVLASMLFGISTKDALTFLAVPAILVAVACAATVIPAWRATSVDPIVALRDE